MGSINTDERSCAVEEMKVTTVWTSNDPAMDWRLVEDAIEMRSFAMKESSEINFDPAIGGVPHPT